MYISRKVKEERAKAKKNAATWLTVIASVLLYVGGVVFGFLIAILVICWLKPEDFKNYTAGLQSIATIAAFAVGGWWTYTRFIHFREGKPKIDLRVEMPFVREQGSQWIITVEALIENTSKVRHQFKDFTFEITYAFPADELQNKTAKDGTALSAEFPRVAAKGSWLTDPENPDHRDDYGALEPTETDRRTFIVCVPRNATMVRAYTELFDEETDESWDATKVLAIPPIAEKGVIAE